MIGWTGPTGLRSCEEQFSSDMAAIFVQVLPEEEDVKTGKLTVFSVETLLQVLVDQRSFVLRRNSKTT